MAYKFNPFTGTFDVTDPGAAGAPTNAEYLTLSLNGTLSNERVLTAGTGITFVDTGANGTLTINLTTPLQENQTRHFVMAMMGA